MEQQEFKELMTLLINGQKETMKLLKRIFVVYDNFRDVPTAPEKIGIELTDINRNLEKLIEIFDK